MSPVHEHGKLDIGGSAHVHDRVDGCAHCAAGEEYIVHEHDPFARNLDFELGVPGLLSLPTCSGLFRVVPVRRDVQLGDGHVGALELLDEVGDALGDGATARAHPTSNRPSVPPLRSSISCAMRVSARRIPSASISPTEPEFSSL